MLAKRKIRIFKHSAITKSVVNNIVAISKGYEVILRGALQTNRNIHEWAHETHEAAKEVASGNADFAIVCCFSGTGASITANKVTVFPYALCVFLQSYCCLKWNNANVFAISLRLTSRVVIEKIIDACFSAKFDSKQQDNIGYIDNM